MDSQEQKNNYNRTLRILWIIHDVLPIFKPYVKGKPTLGGSWITPLFYALKNQSNITLGSITPVINGMEQKKVIDNITYYSIYIRKKENTSNMDKSLAEKYLSVINDFQPDIIHVHGTENNYGLLRKYVSEQIPIVCSIQGIIIPYYECLKNCDKSLGLSRYRTLKNKLGRGGINNMLYKWNKYCHIEKEIYKMNQYFIGRTCWDKEQLSKINPNSLYFHGEELLRPIFYNVHWNLNLSERHRIFVSSAQYPIKGFHLMLKAASILIKEYPNLKIVAPLLSMKIKSSRIKDWLIGEDYNNYLKSLIRKYKLEDNIIIKGRLSADEMAEEYRKAHIFVLPSLIENSPNSLGESMMTGTPSVVSIMGGIPSIVKDNESALLFPSEDYNKLAIQIKRIFSDDNLALKLSKNAINIALKRHDVKQTSNQYYQVYEDIIRQHNESNRNIPRAEILGS